MSTVYVTLDLEPGANLDVISEQMGWSETHRSGSFLSGVVASSQYGSLKRCIQKLPGLRTAQIIGSHSRRHWAANGMGWHEQSTPTIILGTAAAETFNWFSDAPLSQDLKVHD